MNCIDCNKPTKRNRKLCAGCRWKRTYFDGKYWQVLKRDNHTCQECKTKHQEINKLNVHHKDGDHTNNELKNLETLCIKCHTHKRIFECPDCHRSIHANSASQKRCTECSRIRNNQLNLKRKAQFYQKRNIPWFTKYLTE